MRNRPPARYFSSISKASVFRPARRCHIRERENEACESDTGSASAQGDSALSVSRKGVVPPGSVDRDGDLENRDRLPRAMSPLRTRLGVNKSGHESKATTWTRTS